MKKEYIEPRISVVTCSSEHIMSFGSTGTENLNGGNTTGPGTSTKQEEPSKSNSGMSGMSWDDEE